MRSGWFRGWFSSGRSGEQKTDRILLALAYAAYVSLRPVGLFLKNVVTDAEHAANLCFSIV
jgi:hypothetical protein